MVERNAGLTQERRIEFRIGINIGDVIIDGGDIFGDGVNVAVRLEGIAEPGGICVSARVQEYVRGQSEISFEDVGEHRLKNIARPVHAYAIKIGGQASAAPTCAMPAVPRARLSIIVLPFANLSSDPGQDHFVDGVTEDLTTELSRLPSRAAPHSRGVRTIFGLGSGDCEIAHRQEPFGVLVLSGWRPSFDWPGTPTGFSKAARAIKLN